MVLVRLACTFAFGVEDALSVFDFFTAYTESCPVLAAALLQCLRQRC
ncbi:hypothetical protein BH11ACT2_BH11ACT2_03770 [soil metagenome]